MPRACTIAAAALALAACGRSSLVAAPLPEQQGGVGGRVLDCPGPVARAGVDHGDYWPTSGDLGPFWYEAWVMPRAGGGSAWLADGCAGPVAFALGFDDDGRGSARYPVASVPTDGGAVRARGEDGIEAGEWGHVAVGWDGRVLRTYVNGVPVGASPLAGPRRAAPGGCGARLYACGRGAATFDGRLGELRGWEQSQPLGYPDQGFQPEIVFRGEATDGTGRFTPASFLADYTVERAVVPDLSPVGYRGVRHPGTLHGAPDGTDDGSGASGAPSPSWVDDPAAPFTVDHPPTPPAGPPRTPRPAPAGALAFDSFERRAATFAFSPRPSLDSTEAGSLGKLAWRTGCVHVPSECPFGILDGRAVYLGHLPAVAWVPLGAGGRDVAVTATRRTIGTGGAGPIGLALRVRGPDDFLFATLFLEKGDPTVRLGRFAGGVEMARWDYAAPKSAWSRLRVVAAGPRVSVWADDTRLGERTDLAGGAEADATGAGLYIGGALGPSDLSALTRWDDFTVERAP